MIRGLAKKMKKNKKGFTLIELIVVIAILAILALVAAPRVMGYMEKSREQADITTAKNLANAVAMYNASNSARLSEGALNTYDSELGSLVDNDATFRSNTYSGNPYLYYDGNKISIRKGSASGTVVFEQ